MPTCARGGYRLRLWESDCCGTCSGLKEQADVHRGAYPEDTGDELLSTEVHVSTGTKSTSAAKDRGEGESAHVPRTSGDASGSADGCGALLLAGSLLDIMAARGNEREK